MRWPIKMTAAMPEAKRNAAVTENPMLNLELILTLLLYYSQYGFRSQIKGVLQGDRNRSQPQSS